MSARCVVRRGVVAVCVAIGLGGCGTEPGASTSPARVVGSSSSPASPTASPSPSVDRSALQDKVKAATIAAKGLSGLGVSVGPKADKPVTFDVTGACGKRTDADQRDVHVAYNRTWSAEGWWVSNTVHAYGTVPAPEVVAQVKAAVESCRTYTGNDGQYTLHGAVSLPAFPDIEARYGYCQTAKRPDSTFVSCLAFLAKGGLVSSVWTVRGSSQQTNTSGVKQVSAIAADALRRASG